MITPEAVAALAVVIGGVLAAAPRDARLVPFGFLVALVAAPFAAGPATTFALAARVVGGVLAAYVLWIVMRRGAIDREGSAIGFGAELLAGLAAFAVGTQASIVAPLAGPAAAQAAGFALIALAVAPLLGRDPDRLATGAVLLALGAVLVLEGWLGSPSPLTELAIAGLLVGLAGGAAAVLAMMPARGGADAGGAPGAPTEIVPAAPVGGEVAGITR